ncbi:regulator of sirC expression with transglutaminase-like and TPR domain [Volucribacter psittacicida]|uniref:Regulator of sirC expression with transglutaminase-like and TPR domain n=1 Tax=Volucribacter psittacicida TaxID=203482 RepID=A0A4R1G2K2_9PAST|nr:SirB1 family protein [Volucribacter psittacicida]TCK01964.1 regulator of sirC expression with transglutaminase-like and TPR domain [Volucribacter psittacicida]
MKKYNQKALFDTLVSFYLITCDDEGELLSHIRSSMGGLVRKARKQIGEELSSKQKVEHLLRLVYQEWGFHCDPDQYFYVDNLYLAKVFERKQGMPVSLGAIVLYLAASLQLPIYPINFPTQLVLRVDLEEETLFIDPWDGKFISRSMLATLFEGYLGFGHQLREEDLSISSEAEIDHRVYQVAKHALIREGRNFSALQVIEHLLLWHPDDPYEIRDRGLVLANMQCIDAAIADLDYFVEKCPDDPTAVLLVAQLAELKQHNDVLH